MLSVVSGGPQRDLAVHIRVSISPIRLSQPGCHIMLSRVPCAVQEVFVDYSLSM